MKRFVWLKILVVIIVLLTGLFAVAFINKTETQLIKPNNTPEEITDPSKEIAGYQNWTQVNERPEFTPRRIATACAPPPPPTKPKFDENAPHNNKYINVFVNDIGKSEMMTKKSPEFPVGTIIVKEKLTTAESTQPELLTVMIKRAKDFNPQVGDWEFLTFDGTGTRTTARGKLESCQACHIAEEPTDYISRKYLPLEIRKILQ